jgi:hypothetical protein
MRFLRGGTLTLLLKAMTANNVYGIPFAEAGVSRVALNLFVQLLVVPYLEAFAHVLGQ